MIGWEEMNERTEKTEPSITPTVDLDLSLPGDETTCVMVSRIDVRLGTMKPPLGVVSQ